ncbi:MAG TPA: MFS transporter [Propionibacteriaceae bacterium]
MPYVLRAEPKFLVLYGSQVLSVLGDRVTSVALPFAVLAAGGDVRDVALVSAAQFLPVLLAVPAEVWSDGVDRTRILLASDGVRLASQAIAATLLLSYSASPAHLMVTAAVYGAADAFFAPVQGSAVRAVGQREAQVVGAWWQSLRDGGGAVRSRPWVSAILLAMSTYHVVVLPGVFVLGPVLTEQDYAGAGSWVLITIGFGIGSAHGDLIFLWWRPRHALAVAAAALSAASCQTGLIGSGLPAWGLQPALVAMTVIGAGVCLAVASLRCVRTLPRARRAQKISFCGGGTR